MPAISIRFSVSVSEGASQSLFSVIYRIWFDFPFEFDGKTNHVYLESVKGTVALNCNTDMIIFADTLPNAIEINQINATTELSIPKGSKYYTKIKGKSNQIQYMTENKLCEAPSETEAENRIEVAGMNVELLIKQVSL